MSDEWPTHCHEIQGWDTNQCCSTCHDDAYEYGIEPCEIKLGERTLFVCCKCWKWFDDRQEKEDAA